MDKGPIIGPQCLQKKGIAKTAKPPAPSRRAVTWPYSPIRAVPSSGLQSVIRIPKLGPQCLQSVIRIRYIGPQCLQSVTRIRYIGPQCLQSVIRIRYIGPRCLQSVRIIPIIGPLQLPVPRYLRLHSGMSS